jgi:hypothetical protein
VFGLILFFPLIVLIIFSMVTSLMLMVELCRMLVRRRTGMTYLMLIGVCATLGLIWPFEDLRMFVYGVFHASLAPIRLYIYRRNRDESSWMGRLKWYRWGIYVACCTSVLSLCLLAFRAVVTAAGVSPELSRVLGP